MKVKFGILSLALSLGAATLSADDNTKGIDFYRAGMLDEAKTVLLANLQNEKGDNKAETCYFLGEVYANLNMKDSAAYYYKEGLVADPDYIFNSIGELKLGLKENPNQDKAFEGFFTGKNKKNPLVYIAVARAYLPISVDKAKEYMEKARPFGTKSPDFFILEGDVLAAQKKIGEAASCYEMASTIDPECKEAYFKYAKIYTRVNPQFAIDKLNQLIQLDPDYTIVYSELADVYYKNERFLEAADAFSKYVDPESSSLNDLARYATILYLSKKYDEVEGIVSKVLARAPQSTALRRLNMYINYDKGDYKTSYDLAQELMNNGDTSRLISRDYLYYAQILAKNDKHEDAIVAYNKVIQMDTSKQEILRDLAEEYNNVGQFDNAIATYKKFIDNGEDVKLSDRLSLGKIFYAAGTALRTAAGAGPMAEADSVKMIEYLKGADGEFAYIVEKLPENVTGMLWRGRANIAMDDPENPVGLAKPYYEQAIALMEQEPSKYLSSLKEAYHYMGVYFIKKEDYPSAMTYWQKLLQIDPQNADAQRLTEALKDYL